MDSQKLQIVGALQHLFGLLGELLRQGEREIVGLARFERALVGAGLATDDGLGDLPLQKELASLNFSWDRCSSNSSRTMDHGAAHRA